MSSHTRPGNVGRVIVAKHPSFGWIYQYLWAPSLPKVFHSPGVWWRCPRFTARDLHGRLTMFLAPLFRCCKGSAGSLINDCQQTCKICDMSCDLCIYVYVLYIQYYTYIQHFMYTCMDTLGMFMDHDGVLKMMISENNISFQFWSSYLHLPISKGCSPSVPRSLW